MAAKWEVVPATMEHANALAPIMRQSDVEEVMASGGFTPLRALEESLKISSEAHTMFLHGKLAMIFGVAGAPGRPGVIWALGSDVISEHPKAFMRASKAWIEQLKRRHPVLVNAVHSRNKPSLRWVKRLGFTVKEPIIFGRKGELFCPIVWEARRV